MHNRGSFSTLICSLLCLLMTGTNASAAKRMAFVVGIDRYDNLSFDQQLRRATADARAMTTTLKELRFEVIGGQNLSREEFFVAWQRFLGAISPGDISAVFFAGHGVEMSGANYLMPRDVPAATKGERVLRSFAIALTEILHDLDSRKPATAFVVLDACRNNPFTASGRSLGGSRGLARVDERPGTLILYSAGIGQVALDHVPGEPSAANSVFTHTLVPLLKTPGLDLLDVAKQTQRRVDALARRDSHTQTPAFYSQLLTDVYLAGPVATLPVPSAAELEAARKTIEVERKKASDELARREAVVKLREDELRRAEEERRMRATAPPAASKGPGCDLDCMLEAERKALAARPPPATSTSGSIGPGCDLDCMLEAERKARASAADLAVRPTVPAPIFTDPKKPSTTEISPKSSEGKSGNVLPIRMQPVEGLTRMAQLCEPDLIRRFVGAPIEGVEDIESAIFGLSVQIDFANPDKNGKNRLLLGLYTYVEDAQRLLPEYIALVQRQLNLSPSQIVKRNIQPCAHYFSSSPSAKKSRAHSGLLRITRGLFSTAAEPVVLATVEMVK